MKARKTLTSRRIGLLLLTGFLVGLFFVSMGWAASSKPKKHHSKPHRGVARVSKKKPPVPPKKGPESDIALKNYTHPEGQYRLSYPAGWQVDAKDSVLVVKSSEATGQSGVFGIVRRPDDESNDAAIAKEFATEDQQQDMIQMPALLAGLAATKILRSSKEDPDTSLVEYYVKNPEGHQYCILMRAPRSAWKRYNVAFDAMLNSLSFN